MVRINFARLLWGLPVWAWLLIVAILVFEYWIPRRKNARARSILEWGANIAAWMFGRIPVVGPFIAGLGSPKPRVPLEPAQPSGG